MISVWERTSGIVWFYFNWSFPLCPWVGFHKCWFIFGNFRFQKEKWAHISNNITFLLLCWHFSIFINLIYRVRMFSFISVPQLCPTLCDPMNCSTPGLPVHHQLPEFTQTHIHPVDDAQPSQPLSSPFPPVPNPSQHQNLFQWVNSSHEVANGLEFQL